MLDQSAPHSLPREFADLSGNLGNVAAFPSIEPSVPEPEDGKRRRYRTIWISDVHLGTKGCNADMLIDFLDSTDSETMFLLALTYGLETEPIAAISRMVSRIEQVRESEGIAEPFRMTIAVANGQQLYAARHASSGPAPSLYHSRGSAALLSIGCETYDLGEESVIVLSEPLDEVSEHWEAVDPETILEIADGEIVEHPLRIDPQGV